MDQPRQLPALDLQGLSIAYPQGDGFRAMVHDVDLRIEAGQGYGLIGESGSGKSSIAMALMRYLGGARVQANRMRLKELDLFGDQASLERVRGRRIAMVYQNPAASLNPLMRIGGQISEILRLHRGMTRESARVATLGLLADVQLPEPEVIASRFPHQLSGGQQQRVVIAMAIACRPDLLILDEPTTGLDKTTEASILALVCSLRRQIGCAVLLISHDLAVVRQACDRVSVLLAGRIVETGTVTQVLDAPRHPYTQTLVHSAPSAMRAPGLVQPVLLDVQALSKRYGRRSWFARAAGREPAQVLDGVSLEVRRGQTTAVIGQSGSGKTTLGRCVAGLVVPQAGRLQLAGQPLAAQLGRRSAIQKRAVQMVFQNPDASLNPERTVLEILSRPLRLHRLASTAHIQDSARALLARVRLDPAYLTRYPEQLSGGEKQRVAIARAFAAAPELIVLDEPTSALDVTVQAAVLEDLAALQARSGTAYLFISHDLAIVRAFADQVVVMRQGQVVEAGTAEAVFLRPRHPYTRELLSQLPLLSSTPPVPAAYMGCFGGAAPSLQDIA